MAAVNLCLGLSHGLQCCLTSVTVAVAVAVAVVAAVFLFLARIIPDITLDCESNDFILKQDLWNDFILNLKKAELHQRHLKDERRKNRGIPRCSITNCMGVL